MILYGEKLVNTLRQHCDNAKKRIWIAVPFIGNSKEVKQVLGGTWKRPSIDTRILTDVESGFILKETFEEFKDAVVEVRSLKSLHAKIYIIDDWCLITSANLTGTAFSRRYEVGTELDNLTEIEPLFNSWWMNAFDVEDVDSRPSKIILNYQDGGKDAFSRKWKLPPYTSDQKKADKYLVECDKFYDFAKLYDKVTGRNKDMVKDGYTLLMEIDYMFNYLYLDHEDRPSKKAIDMIVRTPEERKQLIRKYFKQIQQNYKEDAQEWKLERVKLFQSKLSPDHIDKLTPNELSQIAHSFHSLNTRSYNINKFLKNNELKTVIKVWKELLHTGDITSDKIKMAEKSLINFGPSSIHEIIAWYYPDTYPMMNSNSECGMRFFGYDV